jgi:hypothetical protein
MSGLRKSILVGLTASILLCGTLLDTLAFGGTISCEAIARDLGKPVGERRILVMKRNGKWVQFRKQFLQDEKNREDVQGQFAYVIPHSGRLEGVLVVKATNTGEALRAQSSASVRNNDKLRGSRVSLYRTLYPDQCRGSGDRWAASPKHAKTVSLERYWAFHKTNREEGLNELPDDKTLQTFHIGYRVKTADGGVECRWTNDFRLRNRFQFRFEEDRTSSEGVIEAVSSKLPRAGNVARADRIEERNRKEVKLQTRLIRYKAYEEGRGT